MTTLGDFLRFTDSTPHAIVTAALILVIGAILMRVL